MIYKLFVPFQTAGASLVYFDFFNATGSASNVELLCCKPVVSGASAVTGVVAVDLFLTRTSAVGTTGTAASLEGTSLTAMTISGVNTQQPINANITARLTPGGGATAGAVLSWRSVFTEETNAGAYASAISDMARSDYLDIPPITIWENSGVRVVQGSVASVGTVGFDITFKVVKK